LLYAVSQWELYRGQGWLRRLAVLPLLVLMGTGLALSNTAAVARGLSNRPVAFRRTPKFHVQDRRDLWQNKRYALPLSWLVLGELALTGYALLTVAVALWRGHYYAAPFLLLYVGGFGMMVVVGVVQSWQRRPARRQPRKQPRPASVAVE
jgi:peptidoglycan/LPS O-acetylase OafA/YrhL